jgi:hypothetical protein
LDVSEEQAMRSPRDFSARDEEEQEWMLENTWCPRCEKADLGMTHPEEYEENGVIWLEGRCAVCDEVIRSQVHIKHV